MPVIRRKLDPNDVYSTDLRYDDGSDTVQTLVNGDWIDNPDADPRTKTLFPPISTSDPACDAAERLMQAFKGTIDNTIELIAGSKTVFTIAGAILALFEFGPWGLFIVLALALANVLAEAGTEALEDAFTGDTWDKFKCIVHCHMGTDGRVKTGEFPSISTDIDSKIGGLAATILDAMLKLSGEGGANNLAAKGNATGDCSECDPCSLCPDISSFVETNTPGVTGTIVNRTDAYIDVVADFYAGLGGGYYIDISTHADDICCVFAGVTVLSGAWDNAAPGGDLHVDCGHNWLVASGGAPTPGNSANRVGYGSSVPFTMRIRWSA